MKKILIIFITSISILCYPGNGQNLEVSTDLPLVFELGEFQSKYENLILDYSDLLLDACDSDMYKAYDQWIDMLKELEGLASQHKVDVRGVKMWLNVFWKANGEIDHFVFHLKPNSKDIDKIIFTKVLENFASSYVFPIKYENNFSHYGSAVFPTVNH